MASFERELVKGLSPQLRVTSRYLLFNIAWTFLAGHFTGNWSQVDRFWPLLPPFYTAIYALFPLFGNSALKLKIQNVQPRPLLMMFLQFIWSIRLTYYAFRRGLLSLNEEDYRWPVFRKMVPNKAFQIIFNFGFVAFFQNCLLYSLSLPAYAAASKVSPLQCGDALLAVLVLLSIAGESIADNQQWVFQKFKKTKRVNYAEEWPGSRLGLNAADRGRGFLTKGLWAYSRHPNVACEQLIWLFMSLFPILENNNVHNFIDYFLLMLPSLSLCLLIYSSTLFTEKISSSKYPAYRLYQQRVAMFWPVETWIKTLYLKYIKGEKIRQSVENGIWGGDAGEATVIPDQGKKTLLKEHSD
ncbi:uncharacterized protein EI90DRAFT_3012788 [Cantharellus anzutake]|uniref:uncharacterized protein n=1 Tax=Cantharellus anzutake TaxID=1750568 RepID=UPI00190471B5|nr:uncharacterized protein EI90DRAFT_3012788 [Cantharellus anzutake]KAF8339866.1 hypothetical protein EI90DRAFT_3012788 [Cantharellus anzutake]